MIIELLEKQPLETITPDKGKEFSKHTEISQAEGLGHAVALFLVMVYDLRQEGVHLAAGTVLRDEGLCDDARTEVGALFHHGHLPDDLRGAGDPGDAGAGRENFGEGTRVNDPSVLVHGEDGR